MINYVKDIIFPFSTFEIPFYQNPIFREFSVLMWFSVFCPFSMFCWFYKKFNKDILHVYLRYLSQNFGSLARYFGKNGWIDRGIGECRNSQKHFGRDLEIERGIHWYLKHFYNVYFIETTTGTRFFTFFFTFYSFFQ